MCKTLLKMLIWLKSEINNTFCFPLCLERVENGAHFWNRRWLCWCRILTPSKLLITCYRQRDLAFGVFLEIFVLQHENFVNVFHSSTFLRSSVTRMRWPDIVRWFWWKLDENRLNDVGDIQRFFSIWHICHLEMKTKLCCKNSIRAAYFL